MFKHLFKIGGLSLLLILLWQAVGMDGLGRVSALSTRLLRLPLSRY